jgi:cell division protein FtsW
MPSVALRLPFGLRRPKAQATLRPARGRPIEHRILLTATLCLLAAGAVMVYSASSTANVLQGRSGNSDLVHFVIFGVVGLVVMQLISRGNLDRVRRLSGPLLVLSFLLLIAVRIPHVGVQINGARRWLGPGLAQFQPSELAKLALVLHSCTLLARRPGAVHTLRGLVPLLVPAATMSLLVATEPDLGTALVVCFTMAALLLAAGVSGRNLAILAGVAIVLVGIYALASPYSRARLTSFIDPWSHAGSSGFQAVQGQIAIGSGGLFGKGPGQSVEKAFYLPEAPTDFILAVIGEELGAVGVIILLGLYGLIAYAGLRTARAARSPFSALLAVGVTTLIVSEALLNVFAVLGLAPLTGVPLPFVSYGSSSLLVMLASMGLLLNISTGGTVHLRASGARRRSPDDGAPDRDRGRRDGRPRRAGPRGR